MSRMPSLGSLLPGGYVLGALHHTDRISLIYEATVPDGVSPKASAQVLHPLHVEELRTWFELGGVLQQQLKHPSLPAVLAMGYTDNDLPVMITEWLDGRTLRQELSGPRLPAMSEVVQVVREVGSALEYLHGRNPKVLHRAVMPEHVMRLEGSRAVKLLGVGQADRPGPQGNRYLYVPPEALESNTGLSPSVDVFSLAVLTFELITGKAPFKGEPKSVAAQMQRGALPFITGSASEAMQPIDETLHRAWAADPWERTQDVRTFLLEIDDAVKKVPAGLLARQRALMEQAARTSTDPSTDATTRLAAVTDTAATRHFGRPRRMTESAPRRAIVAEAEVFENGRPGERRLEPRRPRAESERVLAVESGSLARADIDSVPTTVDVGDAIISVDSTEIDDPAVLEAISDEVTDVAYVAAWTRLTDDLQEQITNVRPLEMIVPTNTPRRARQRQATQAGPALRPGWQPGAPSAPSTAPALRVSTPLPRPPQSTAAPSAPGLATSSSAPSPIENPKFPLAQGAVIRPPKDPTPAHGNVPSWDEWSPFRHQRAPQPWHRRELRLTLPALLAILVANGLIIAVLIAVFTIALR